MTENGRPAHFVRGFVVLLLGSVIGKIAGLAREIIFAAAFGSGLTATAFKSSQSAVLVSANLVTGDVLSAAFVPAYAQLKRRDAEQAKSLLWSYLLFYGALMVAIAAVLFVVRVEAIDFLIPGAASAIKSLAAEFLGTLSWCIPLFGLASIAGYALATDGRYTATSLRSTLQTAGLLVGTVFAIWFRSPTWLASGFVLAWIVYTGWCFVLLIRFGMLGAPNVRAASTSVRIVLANMVAILPLAVVPVGVQITTVVQRIIASHGPSGLIASVDYAQTLSDSMVTLISVPLGFVGLTQLSTVAEGEVRSITRRIVSCVMGVGLPVTFVLLPLTGLIVRVVYRHGEFNAAAAILTTQVAFGLFCGLSVQILGYALTRALSARRRNRAVLWITITGQVVEISLQLLSIPFAAPVFIGIGISAYGLVLTLGAAWTLGVLRRLGDFAITGAAASVGSVAVLLAPPVPWFLKVAVVVVLWAATLRFARPYRSVIADLRSILLRRRRRTSPGEPLSTVSPAEQ